MRTTASGIKCLPVCLTDCTFKDIRQMKTEPSVPSLNERNTQNTQYRFVKYTNSDVLKYPDSDHVKQARSVK